MKRAQAAWLVALFMSALGARSAAQERVEAEREAVAEDSPAADPSDEDEASAAPAPAAVPEPAAVPPDERPVPATPERAPNDKKKRPPAFEPRARAPRDLGRVEVGARIFARAAYSSHHVEVSAPNGALSERRIDAFDLSVPSARAELRYRAPMRWLSATLEVEFADEIELKDAFVRARGKHLSVKVGQFKAPFSAIELESIWDLPIPERGLLNDLLVGELEIAGRRPGVTFAATTGGDPDLSLTLGAFQGSVLVERDGTDRNVDPLFEESLRAQSFFARAGVEIGDLAIGVGYEQRIGTRAEYVIDHYFTLGGDLVLDTRVLGRGFRLWLEGMAGGSWFEHSRKPTDDRDAVFTAGRLIVAPRFGGLRKRELYLEPYGRFGLFDPDTEVAQDLVFEQGLGINVGLWRVARLGLEVGFTHVQRNLPVSYGLGKDPDRVAVLLQAGVQF